MRTLKYHSDAGHGWLAVKVGLLNELGLIDKITRYSYIRGKTAYLECDVDVGTFVEAHKAKYGRGIEAEESYKQYSNIRSYEAYSAERAKLALNGRDGSAKRFF
jgi:hypothetical protein